MRDIAKAVGLQPASLYSHIGSKEELLIEILADLIEKFRCVVDVLEDMNRPPDERLRDAIVLHVRVVEQNLEEFGVLDRDWRFVGEKHLPRLRRDQRQYEAAFARVIGEGMKAGLFEMEDARVTTRAIMVFLASSAWVGPHASISSAVVADRFATLALNGWARRPAPTRR
jgi:AcrR family transcriptional regulator